MSTIKTWDVPSSWTIIRQQLEHEKGRIYEEIGHYPPPIPACDQQFNHLLDEQKKISGELARLTEAETDSLSADDPSQVINQFVQSSPYIDLLTMMKCG